MCSAVSRRGLQRGLSSRAFSAAELRAAAAAAVDQPACVLVDVDAEGYMCAPGAGSAARAAVCARLAPHVQACTAVLCRDAAGALRLQMTRAVAPLHELLLWFDEDLLAAVDMPFLTLQNIRGRKDYECHECGARFEEPNPLKTHLFLRCAPHAPARFWHRFASRAGLCGPRAPAPSSAFRRVAPGDTLEASAAAARLEALATEWGGARGGHACVYCGKLYSRKYGLKIHLRTHTGYRPLRCRHCARAFGDPSNLNKHVRLHGTAAPGTAAPHACPRCRKPLARRRDLERHLRAHCTSPPAAAAAAAEAPAQ